MIRLLTAFSFGLSLTLLNATPSYVSEVEVLIDRAELVTTLAYNVVYSLSNQSSAEHLLVVLQNEVGELEAHTNRTRVLMFTLVDTNQTHRTSQLNTYEEFLLWHTNRVQEEVDFLREVFPNPHAPLSAQLIVYAQTQVRVANELVAKHKAKAVPELSAVRFELSSIDLYLGELLHKSDITPERKQIAEQQLLGEERKMATLIERIHRIYGST